MKFNKTLDKILPFIDEHFISLLTYYFCIKVKNIVVVNKLNKISALSHIYIKKYYVLFHYDQNNL